MVLTRAIAMLCVYGSCEMLHVIQLVVQPFGRVIGSMKVPFRIACIVLHLLVLMGLCNDLTTVCMDI